VARKERLRWVFAWHDARNFVRRVWEGAEEAHVSFLASGLAFDTLLAAIPFAFVALALVGYILNAHATASRLELTAYLQQLFPTHGPQAANPFQPVIRLAENVVRSRGKMTLYGLPLFIWFATRLFGSLRSVLCEVFDTQETRSWFRGKLSDAGLVVATALLITVYAFLSDGIAVLGGHPGFAEFFAAQVLAFGFLLVLFGMVFKFTLARPIEWRTALVAAVTCAVGFDVAKELLGVYVRGFIWPDDLASDATLGAILLLVAWTYYMAFIFLIGAQIAQVYELGRRKVAQRAVLH
jgi:membrane protein